MKKFLIFLLLFLFLNGAKCLACEHRSGGYRYYFGADVQLSNMNFKKGYGDKDFHHNHGQGNIHAGIRFNEFIAVELGYKSTLSKIRDVVMGCGDSSCGTIFPGFICPIVFKGKIKVDGPHIDIVRFFPLSDYPGKFFGSVGFGLLRARAERKTILFFDPPIYSGTVRTFKKQKAVLRFGGGFEGMVTSNVGIRTSVYFVNTGRMIIIAQELPGRFTPMIRAKNSVIYSVGGFFIF